MTPRAYHSRLELGKDVYYYEPTALEADLANTYGTCNMRRPLDEFFPGHTGGSHAWLLKKARDVVHVLRGRCRMPCVSSMPCACVSSMPCDVIINAMTADVDRMRD